jgi:gluconokinase
MGVAGAGKTTIGTMLAAALHCPYVEGDTRHPEANVWNMRRGIPLTDRDRAPWLAAIHRDLAAAYRNGQTLVVGCSALKRDYRRILAEDLPIIWVYLRGPAALIRARLAQRSGHFIDVSLLDSQLEALEEPAGAIVADIALPPEQILQQILAALPAPPPPLPPPRMAVP